MADYTIIKLKNLSPLHIGTGKENYDFSASELQSDTISSSLAAIRAQQGNTDDVEEFLNSFSISSAFPFWKNHYFLPKPNGKINIQIKDKEEKEYRKKLKGLKFIEKSIWENLINGENIVIEEEQLNCNFVTNYKSDIKPLFKSQVSQRVSVPRCDGQPAEPFFFDWKYFDKEGGLYCIINTDKKTLKEIIDLFVILGEYGIGTDKNIGGGKFEVETSSIEISCPTNNDSCMLLSLYIPNEEEFSSINLNDSKYEILSRGGYIAGSEYDDLRHLRKKSIYMFNCGSILKTSSPLKGKIVNLRPEYNDNRLHNIYRSGKPLFIPIKSNEL